MARRGLRVWRRRRIAADEVAEHRDRAVESGCSEVVEVGGVDSLRQRGAGAAPVERAVLIIQRCPCGFCTAESHTAGGNLESGELHARRVGA